MSELTVMEKFERECEMYEKIERIGKFLDEEHGASIPVALKKNSYLLYGMFDPINRDQFGNKIVARMKSGKGFPFKYPKMLFKRINAATTDELLILLHMIKPSFLRQVSIRRLAFYLVNIKLSELGIAPRWRGMNTLPFIAGRVWEVGELRYMRDMQVFDMEWVYRKYPKHRVVGGYNGIITKLMKCEQFDFADAHMIAAAHMKSEKKAKLFKLTKDMMNEMAVLRDKRADRKNHNLMKKLEEVEADIVLAAHRNPCRGKKLLRVLDERLKLWQSEDMTDSSSPSVMIENYQKMTGQILNRSSFKSKLESLNDALHEVGSKHAF